LSGKEAHTPLSSLDPLAVAEPEHKPFSKARMPNYLTHGWPGGNT